MADKSRARCMRYWRTGVPIAEFITPCEVMKATMPPSRTASSPLTKK